MAKYNPRETEYPSGKGAQAEGRGGGGHRPAPPRVPERNWGVFGQLPPHPRGADVTLASEAKVLAATRAPKRQRPPAAPLEAGETTPGVKRSSSKGKDDQGGRWRGRSSLIIASENFF